VSKIKKEDIEKEKVIDRTGSHRWREKKTPTETQMRDRRTKHVDHAAKKTQHEYYQKSKIRNP